MGGPTSIARKLKTVGFRKDALDSNFNICQNFQQNMCKPCLEFAKLLFLLHDYGQDVLPRMSWIIF